MGIKHAQSPQAFFCSLLKRFEYATDISQTPNRFNNHYAAQPGSREGLRKSAQPLTFTLDCFYITHELQVNFPFLRINVIDPRCLWLNC